MRFTIDRTGSFNRTLLVTNYVLIFTIWILTLDAYAMNSINLQGDAFSDPSEHVEMDETWRKQSIVYKNWGQGADIVLSLDQHMYDALLPMIQDYAKKHTLKIEAQKGTCGLSNGRLIKKTVDITGFCCPPGKVDRLPGIEYHTVGISANTIIVHKDNPIDNITLDEARQIFQGKITRWSQLKNYNDQSGAGRKIYTIARLHCKLRPGHWRLLLDNEDLFGLRLHGVGHIEDVIYQVSINPLAIGGFESPYMMLHQYPQKNEVKLLNVDGYSPRDPEDLIAVRYPIYFVFNLTTWQGKETENPNAGKLVDYLLQHTEEIESRYNFVPHTSLRKSGWKFTGNELTGVPE